jgi:catechol 2,3-dioxygenase-like lactoylglutathione lyase family enzyme
LLVQGVHTVIIFAQDMDAQLAWYHDVLGLGVRFRFGDFAVFDTGPIQLAMHGGAEPAAGAGPQRTIVALTVEDYAGAKAALEARGVKFTFENETPTAKFGTFLDPEGTQVQILQPKAR